MAVIVARKEAILHKVVLEIRYSHGFTYLDKCGLTVNTIQRQYPEWILRTGDPNPQNAPLMSLEDGCVFNFSARKMDFGLERSVEGGDLDTTRFADRVDDVSSIVVEKLGLNEFTRIGCRVWYLFSCNDKKECEKWLMGLELFAPTQKLESSFGSLEASGFSAVFAGQDRNYRIAFNGVQRTLQVDLGEELLNIPARSLPKRQKEHFLEQLQARKRIRLNPEFAAMIDIDAYQEDPEAETLSPKDFVKTSISESLERLQRATSSR